METSLMAPQMDGLFYWGVWARWSCLVYSWLLVYPWVRGTCGVSGPDQGGLGLPHHPMKSQLNGRELENQRKCQRNQSKNITQQHLWWNGTQISHLGELWKHDITKGYECHVKFHFFCHRNLIHAWYCSCKYSVVLRYSI